MSAAVTQSKPNGIPTPAELGFNPAELRQKYAEERAKRLRADGNNQYQEITGEHAHYNADPYVKPGFTRPALHEESRANLPAILEHRTGLERQGAQDFRGSSRQDSPNRRRGSGGVVARAGPAALPRARQP